MQGNAVTFAPRALSFPQREPLRSAGRVTITSRPFRGRLSNQSKLSDRLHTLPTTMMAGLTMFASSAARGSFSSVDTTFRCRGRVPLSITAAGVSGDIPAACNPWQISGRVLTPMRNTSVPPARHSASKSMHSGTPARAWPVMMWTEEQ